MKSCTRYLSFWIGLLALAGWGVHANGIDSISISIDQGRTFHPGDLIEMKVSVRSNQYASYNLREPTHPSLRYLETQAFPVRKIQQNRYVQHWVVLYQMSRSGVFALEGGFLVDEADLSGEPISIDSISMASQGFGLEKDSNTPEAIRIESGLEETSRWVSFAVILSLAAAIAYWRWQVSRKRERESVVEESPLRRAVSNLLAKLDSGQTPIVELERFYHDYGSACSRPLADTLERAVYSEKGQWTELKNRLREDFLR